MIVQHMKCEPCRKAGVCVRTGECCHIREDVVIDPLEDKRMKEAVFDTSGVIYLYPLSRYTISLSEAEARWMKNEAKTRGITLNILPKRILYDEQSEKAFVFDWFVDHDVCPFLHGTNHCSIYANRPLICKDFPFKHLKTNQLDEIKTFISAHKIHVPILPNEAVVKLARDSLKRQGITI